MRPVPGALFCKVPRMANSTVPSVSGGDGGKTVLEEWAYWLERCGMGITRHPILLESVTSASGALCRQRKALPYPASGLSAIARRDSWPRPDSGAPLVLWRVPHSSQASLVEMASEHVAHM